MNREATMYESECVVRLGVRHTRRMQGTLLLPLFHLRLGDTKRDVDITLVSLLPPPMPCRHMRRVGDVGALMIMHKRCEPVRGIRWYYGFTI